MAARGMVVVEASSLNNPSCTHGPTVLFERFLQDGSTRRFYACAACRDAKDCPFFLWADHKMSKAKRKQWTKLSKEKQASISHQERFKRLEEVRSVEASERVYCNSCSVLMVKTEQHLHQTCSIITPIEDNHLAHPSTILPPKENAKVEAQYLFSSRSVEVLVGMLKSLNASGVLCVGAPRIHEAITATTSTSMSSLLLDIDDRYCSFLPPESFLLYNMFNHHFFDGKAARKTYLSFLAGQEKLVLLSDPPFGGRVELLAHTLAAVETDWRTQRRLDSSASLPVLFVFPYFLESQVLASLPSLAMLDYQVDYDNHPIYSRGPKGMKHGSAVRVFTNQPLHTLPLPEEEGYRWCEPCQRWVYKGNIHCDICKACPSKDGRTYIHCKECGRCVKPGWKHCSECDACRPQDHDCKPKPVGCYTCGNVDHKHLACPKRKKPSSPSSSSLSSSSSMESKKKKRKKGNSNLPKSLAEERQRNLDILSQILDGKKK